MPVDAKAKSVAKGKRSTAKPGAGDSLSKEVQAVYDQCLEAGVLLSADRIQSFLPAEKQSDINAALSVINQLLARRLLEAVQHNENVLYKVVTQTEARRMGGMDGDEAMIYQYIKAAGNQGIWTSNLKARTGLHLSVVTHVLKQLQAKSFIKCVKSVQNPIRKIFMLYDLTPNVEVSGGPWFTESELDVEFVGTMCRAIEQFIRSKSRPKKSDFERIYAHSHADFPDAQQVADWLQAKRLTPVDLSIHDVQSLLEILVHDGKIERLKEGIQYKSVSRVPDQDMPNAYTDMPCGQCPVSHLCHEGGVVSPEGCEYWQDWLNSNL